MARKWAAAMSLLAGVLSWDTGPAGAGGGRLAPVQERYEPGQTATVVGYTGAPVADEAFYAYLRPAGQSPGARLVDTDLYVGELVVEATTHGGYLARRVSLTFDVPDELPVGEYELRYCDDPCTDVLLGDLVPSPLSIGVAPARRVVREWAPDEPEIANLAPDALLVGPGLQATAAEVRSGRAARVPVPPPTTVEQSIPPPVAAPAPAVPVTAPVAVEPDGGMPWPVPAALVLAAGAGTAVVLSRRQRAAERRWVSWPGPPAARGGRSPGTASAGRG